VEALAKFGFIEDYESDVVLSKHPLRSQYITNLRVTRFFFHISSSYEIDFFVRSENHQRGQQRSPNCLLI